MADYIEELVGKKRILTESGRSLLSVAFKNLAGGIRSSWRAFSKPAQEADKLESWQRKVLLSYMAQLRAEFYAIRIRVMDITSKLLDSTKDPSPTVFYLKMKGDYERTVCELTLPPACEIELLWSQLKYFWLESGDYHFSLPRDVTTYIFSMIVTMTPLVGIKEAEKRAETYYETAKVLAEQHLKTTDAIRLGLMLNYSVFTYEIQQDLQKTVEMQQNAFDDALADLDDLTEDGTYRDNVLIMQLLRDSLALYTDAQEDEESEDAA